MSGYLNAGVGIGGLLLDLLQTINSNQRGNQRRNELIGLTQGAYDDFNPQTRDEYLTGDMFDNQPSALFNPDQLMRQIMGLRTQFGNAGDDAYGEFETQLGAGLEGTQRTLGAGLAQSDRNLESALAGMRRITQGGIDEQNRHRLELGSTFGLLGLDDPDVRFQEALTFGNEAAAANQNAALRSEIDNSFGEQARLGVDPFEAGAFGGTRQRLTDRRFTDLFAGRQAAAGERNRIQEFNVGARQGALESEQATNRNIDSAIAALSRGEQDNAGNLYGTRMTTDAGLYNNLMTTDAGFREGMLGNLFTRQTGIEGNYLPQIAGLQEALARLTQEGQADEATRLQGNIGLANEMYGSDLEHQDRLYEALLAAIGYDPTMFFQSQNAVQQLPFMDN